mmetsp:Transcript_57936/g.116151  ORF Transcript_57936/g.116151 Transcript_57936/m.116151 type:complete len:418 (+) Transcript_57936:194-1447(+)
MEPKLNDVLHAAAREVLPPEQADAVLEPGEGALPCSQLSRGDYACRLPRTVFHRMRRGGNGKIEYSTTSDFGVVRTWCFTDPVALAKIILEHLPKGADAIIADARATDEGTIAITTCSFLAWQRTNGKLHCPDCGYFFAGERGLKDHQLMKHRKVFTDAQEVISQSRLQVVPYQQLNLFAASTPAQKEAESAKQRVTQTAPALEEGLVAARDGDLATLRALVAAGWDVRAACDRRGSNALLWAAGGGHLEVCQYLLDECGLDPRWVQPKDHRNALHWAARNGQLDVCRWLVAEKGLDPDVPTADGTVALHWAVWQGHESVCDFLIHEARADLHAVNSYGCNASQWAALVGSVRMCSWLQRAGLDLKVLNSNGHSALHKASMKGQSDVCRWLVTEAGLGSRQMDPGRDGKPPARRARP